MSLPFAEKAGSNSRSLEAVRRWGVPLGSSLRQRYPTALKSNVFPSGDVTAWRMALLVNSSAKAAFLKCKASEIFKVASIWKGMSLTFWDATSMLLIFPFDQITIAASLGVQLKPGYTP